MEKLLTIVIPAYNMEKYLHRCLDSIIVESVMDKVQVLIVNDGSKDRTSEIAHEYENKYPHYIKVIDKKNGNYGSCMNVGLSQAKGKYFRSLDADDWFDTKNYAKFVEELENTDADMLVGDRYEYYEETKEIKHVGFSTDTILFNKDLPMTNKNCNFEAFYTLSMVWGITYKTCILRDSGLKWDEGVFYTDNEFDFWPLKLVKTIRFIPLPVYVYLKGREGQSIDLKIQKRNFNSYVIVSNTIVDELLKVYDERSEVKELQLHFAERVIDIVYYKLLAFDFGENQAINSLTEKLLQNKNIYNFFNDNLTCYGIKYIDAFRHNKCQLYYLRLKRYLEKRRYQLATNKTIRRLLGKK